MRRGTTVSILLLAATILTATLHAQEGDVAGSWVAVQAERDGIAAPELLGHQLVMEGGRFAISANGSILYAGTYATDPVAVPPAIDFQHEAGALLGTTWEGIYERDSQRLIICDDAADPATQRPTDFTTSPGSGRVLLTFQGR